MQVFGRCFESASKLTALNVQKQVMIKYNYIESANNISP